jgi:hypothetical protein
MRKIATLTALAGLSLSSALFAENEKPVDDVIKTRSGLVLKNPRERGLEWIGALDRLRAQPRAGEIQNAGVTAYLTDIADVSDEQKAAIQKLLAEYDAAALSQAAKWEESLKALRAQHEAKMLEVLPAERREALGAALKLSHESWVSGCDLRAGLQRGSIERAKKMQQAAAPTDDASRVAHEKWLKEQRLLLQKWLKEQSAAAAQKDQEVLAKIRGLLLPDEIRRLEACDADRVVAPPAAKPDAPAK